MTIQDKSLPHQIQLVFSDTARRCLNGAKPKRMDVVVTCNCYRIGDGGNFMAHIAPAPTLEDAWAAWNQVEHHIHKDTFTPRLKEIEDE